MNSGYPLVLDSLIDTDPEIFVVDEGEQNSRTMQNVWESKGYFCNQCEYRSTNQMSLKAHKQSKHDSVIYTGNECEYQTSNKYSLKIQNQYKHGGVLYSCNVCEYQTFNEYDLKKTSES